MIVVNRCQCFDKTFASLRDVAQQTGSNSIPVLQQHIEFGKKCQLCHPYIQRMLETGETVFHEILAAPYDVT